MTKLKITVRQKRLLDLVLMIVLVLVVVVITTKLKPSFLVTTFLFFGLPSLFLLWRKPVNFKKVTLAALLLGVVWGFSFDYIAEFNNAWGWSTNTKLTLPVEFFGVVSLDILIWYFLWVFLTVLFYEYFAEHDFSQKISPKYRLALLVGAYLVLLSVALSKLIPSLLKFNYAYFTLGSLTLVPFIFITSKRPTMFKKVLEITPFFVFLYLAFELVALNNNLWGFPGQYIGTVSIGSSNFPLEELLFWVILSSAVTASYHEFVVDDWR